MRNIKGKLTKYMSEISDIVNNNISGCNYSARVLICRPNAPFSYIPYQTYWKLVMYIQEVEIS